LRPFLSGRSNFVKGRPAEGVNPSAPPATDGLRAKKTCVQTDAYKHATVTSRNPLSTIEIRNSLCE
jgi:hypothetical protein